MEKYISIGLVILIACIASGCSKDRRSSSAGGTSSGVSANSITPPVGSTTGGDAVTVTGANFSPSARVFFDQAEATNVTVAASGQEITLTTPAHPAGVVDVRILGSDGSTTTLNNAFTFDPSLSGGGLARVADYGNPTGAEQEMLELANRARRDPTAEGNRLGVNLSGYAARPPLTHNGFLAAAAKGHIDDMQARNFYGHTNPDGIGPNRRVLATNYDLRTAGTAQDPGYDTGVANAAINETESIGIGQGNQFNSPQAMHNAFVIDQGQVPPKHRDAILGYGGQLSSAREIGYGLEFNQPRPTTTPTGALFAPDHWASSELARTQRDRAFITGVVYYDADRDGVARNGEGRGGVTVTLSHASGFTLSTRTAAAGGYAFETFVDADFTISVGSRSGTITVGKDTVKVDDNGFNLFTYRTTP